MSSLFSGDFTQIFMNILVRAIVVFTALPIHEFAHGFVANKLGDHTAKYQGRLTLNPLAHFDIIGTTALLLTGYGWAKPVPINPYNFKNRKAGMALSALAGPVSNILLATVCMILLKLVGFFLPASAFTTTLFSAFSMMVSINIGLAVFNLIPIPPLDGSKILNYFLPEKITNVIYQYERYIMFGLFALVMFTPVLNYPISVMSNFIFKGIDFLTKFIDILAGLIH